MADTTNVSNGEVKKYSSFEEMDLEEELQAREVFELVRISERLDYWRALAKAENGGSGHEVDQHAGDVDGRGQ
jgi:hypothetical protein